MVVDGITTVTASTAIRFGHGYTMPRLPFRLGSRNGARCRKALGDGSYFGL